MSALCLEPVERSDHESQATHNSYEPTPHMTGPEKRQRSPRGLGPASSSVVVVDAPNLRETIARVAQDHSWPAGKGSELDLTSFIDFKQLGLDLRERLATECLYWIDTPDSGDKRPEWQLARRGGWQVRLPSRRGQNPESGFIQYTIARAHGDALRGSETSICLVSHSNRYATPLAQFSQAGGRLYLTGFLGCFGSELYELSDTGAELIDIQLDCRAATAVWRQMTTFAANPMATN